MLETFLGELLHYIYQAQYILNASIYRTNDVYRHIYIYILDISMKLTAWKLVEAMSLYIEYYVDKIKLL